LKDDGDWTRWRIELTAYGEYVELSFEDIHLRSDADAARWASELRLALSHYEHRVDVLLDLRGLHVGAKCASCCAHLLGELLEQHAAALAFFGADAWTLAALEPGLGAGALEAEGGRSRTPALERLMSHRQRRLAGRFPVAPHLAGAGDGVQAPGWTESGGIAL